MERESTNRERHESRAGSTYKAFLRDVEALGGFDEKLAEQATVSVLCALDRRIRGEEARQLHAQLPSKLRELVQRCELHAGEKPEKFDREEMFEAVASDLGRAAGEVEGIVRTVFLALRSHVSEGEAEDVASQLPQDIADLWMRPA